MRHLRLISYFARASAQQELAYRTNFFINVLNSLLNFGTGVLGLVVLFNQIDTVRGWTFASTLALLGVYLILGALRGLFIEPSLDSLAGMNGSIWHGTFDFTLLRPVSPQFMSSFQRWNPLALFELLLGVGVLGTAIAQLNQTLSVTQLAFFLLSLVSSVLILYSLLLGLTSLVFWGPGFFYTWIFNGIFQMARYPVGLYPGWLRLVLTWIVPVGMMTTIPAQAMGNTLTLPMLLLSLTMSIVLLFAASALFQTGLRRYASASS
ncbi:ABC-2 family transporter protein [Chloroflexi bacterium TSY]|nr:ABC-2 family transporter protein [Chloroflexi bacterium TSY]